MTPTDFSVLLLAWDDADPAVAVLGGSALPPTLPLVYQLAARHPVLAVYPHLPAAGATAALEPLVPPGAAAAAAAAAADSAPAASPLDAATDAPGVHLLGLAATATRGSRTSAAGGSRLVGLSDLPAAIQGALPTSHSLFRAPEAARDLGGATAARSPTPPRSQWPARPGSPLPAGAWQAPAAPYAGAAMPPYPTQTPSPVTARETFPPPPPAPPRPVSTAPAPSATRAANETPAPPATPAAAAGSAAQATSFLPSAPASDDAGKVPAPFDEPVAEMGAAEAHALDAPEDDLVPDVAPPAVAQPEAPASGPAPGRALRQPRLDGLNFRMIEYARRAAQLVDGRHDFGVIYAPNWPAWVAALEIRNRSGRPLVLYVPALASDTAPAAERGWLLGVERMALRRATLVLVPDADVLRQLRARHPDALGEVRIVPAEDEATVQLVLAEVALS